MDKIVEVEGKKYRMVKDEIISCCGCVGNKDGRLCEKLPDCFYSGKEYIFKEVKDA